MQGRINVAGLISNYLEFDVARQLLGDALHVLFDSFDNGNRVCSRLPADLQSHCRHAV